MVGPAATGNNKDKASSQSWARVVTSTSQDLRWLRAVRPATFLAVQPSGPDYHTSTFKTAVRPQDRCTALAALGRPPTTPWTLCTP